SSSCSSWRLFALNRMFRKRVLGSEYPGASAFQLYWGVGMKGPKGSWKKECMVVPPALMAATPVGATTAIFLKLVSVMYFRNVVFPVPARPVRKRLRAVWLTKRAASSNTGLCGSVVMGTCNLGTKYAGEK